MNILLTNDDGIGSEGFKTLVDALKDKHRLFIVAPEAQQSAKSHSITMNYPIYANQVNFYEHSNIVAQYAVSGTPVDCVKLAIDVLIEDRIDLVVSGINHGPNIAEDVVYSGTVGAAYEAVFYNIPGIALSLCDHSNFDFSGVEKYIESNIESLYKMLDNETKYMLNINFPNNSTFNGTKLTKLGSLKYVDVFTKRKTPHGKDYYWLAGERCILPEHNNNSSDTIAINDGYVSISPIRMSMDFMPDGVDALKMIDDLK